MENIIPKEIQKVLSDLAEGYGSLPENDSDLEKIKCSLRPGQHVQWYHKQYVDYLEEGEDPHQMPEWGGIIVPKDGIEYNNGEIEAEDCMVVCIDNPTEKCYPEVFWISLLRLVSDSDLLEIFDKK